ncbi:hypothetical protein BCR35DRAFT_332503 [Leucosporidium creatinivorum]|uniref:MYND-type domain-containing protein n=1 Tax=Leucosporidium creatinivorum TaxID=106004 RepID=A0A1Y2F252_9BASI|nr:hypothetical protein BCR35DRAFT_332503 [Leucosporidium creatinivorum]
MPLHCQNCLEGLGGNTGRKVLTCGRCKRAAYCSKDCQKSDYPRHKPQCHSTVEQQQLMAQLGKSLPGLDRYEKDVQQLRPGIHGEATVAARSALRVGTSSSLHDSHFLLLTLEYNQIDGLLRQRFTFKNVSISPFEGGEASMTPAELSRQETFRSVRTTMREHDPVAGTAGSAGDFFSSHFHHRKHSCFTDLKSWPPNPDLPALLRRIFDAPRPLPSHSIFRDDYLSTFRSKEAKDRVRLIESIARQVLLKEGVELLE